MSYDCAKEFLEKNEINSEDSKQILNCVEAHHGKVPYTCIEAEICANADCYRFLTPKNMLTSAILI